MLPLEYWLLMWEAKGRALSWVVQWARESAGSTRRTSELTSCD